MDTSSKEEGFKMKTFTLIALKWGNIILFICVHPVHLWLNFLRIRNRILSVT